MTDLETSKKTRTRKIGSRQEVFDGVCERTSGGLTKDDLVFNDRTSKLITLKEQQRGISMRKVMTKVKEPEQEEPEQSQEEVVELVAPPVEKPKRVRKLREPKVAKQMVDFE